MPPTVSARHRSPLYGVNTIKEKLKSRLSPEHWAVLRKRYTSVAGLFVSANLMKLASLHGTDKWNSHWYAQHYQRHFGPLRRKTLNVLEIGIGGYDNPQAGGDSLRMWKQFFPRSQIYGIDIYDKSAHAEPRITIFQGSQTDETFLRDVVRQVGRLDIVIDDGSHVNEHMIASFEILFPLLPVGAIYAIEDTQTSYWPGKYGGSRDLKCPSTLMNRLKCLIDGLNFGEFLDPEYEPSGFDRSVSEVHFYHNLAVIYKGDNDEASPEASQQRQAGAAALVEDRPAAMHHLQ